MSTMWRLGGSLYGKVISESLPITVNTQRARTYDTGTKLIKLPKHKDKVNKKLSYRRETARHLRMST